MPVEIGGKTYLLSTLKAKHWGEAARALNAKRKSPMEIVKQHLASLPAESQRVLLELAYRDERDGDLIPTYEINRWFLTEEGAVWRFWAQIRQHHPEITIEQAEELAWKMDAEETARVKAAATANEALPQGNSSGQVQTIQETAGNGRSPGVVHSAN